MSSSPDEAAERAERLARLYRVTLEGEATEATRALVKSLLLAELGDTVALSALTPAAPAVPVAASASSASAPTPAPVRSGASRTPEQLELKMRQLVDADAGWERLEPLALALFRLKGDPATAARLAELAFLHGTTAQLEEVLGRFKSGGGVAKDFYRHIHAAVRAHLVARLWKEGEGDTLASLLFRDRDEEYLQPIERLYVFQSMANAKDAATPYMYFRRWRRELLAAAGELGAHLELTLAAFLLAVGRLAIDLGYDGDARELLEQIAEDEPERDEALRLLLDVSVERNKAGRSHYVELLLGHSSTQDRLKLINQFLSATRGLGGFKDKNRPALNEILKDPLSWLTEEADAWATMSELLVANRDLDTLLPNLFEVFRANAVSFKAPVLDAALWQGPLGMHAETPRDRYWRGVALLHNYVQVGPGGEACLWEARSLVASARYGWHCPLPFQWKELHKVAFAWVAKSHYLLEADRDRMLRQLRVAVDESTVTVVDLEDYAEHADAPPLPVLRSLQGLAAAKQAPTLETRLILKSAAQSHLTNADLNRIWQLANDRKDSDLAWRVATVLNARQALAAPVRHAWEISGEKRAHYPFVAPPKAVVERCLRGFAPRAARLAYASLHVGPVLPELLAMLDPGVSVARLPGMPGDSVEAKVEQALAGVSWLPPPRRRYRFSFEAAHGGTQLPGFMQVLPANPWSLLVARLSERIGANAWGWKVSRLGAQIADLIPRLATRQDLRRHSGRVAKWLKDLSPEQRAAWTDLAALSRSIEDDRAAEALAVFVCRLATAMLPHHFMALTSLQVMRAPAGVIWELEAWLLSDAYTEIRQQLGMQNRVLVPNALQRLETIVI